VNYGREFFRTHQVSQTTLNAARIQFGVQGLVELTNLMGYYALLAFNINAFGEGSRPKSVKLHCRDSRLGLLASPSIG
jgi:hypothetical protein